MNGRPRDPLSGDKRAAMRWGQTRVRCYLEGGHTYAELPAWTIDPGLLVCVRCRAEGVAAK